MGTSQWLRRGQALGSALRGPGWSGIRVLQVGCLGQILLLMAQGRGG